MAAAAALSIALAVAAVAVGLWQPQRLRPEASGGSIGPQLLGLADLGPLLLKVGRRRLACDWGKGWSVPAAQQARVWISICTKGRALDAAALALLVAHHTNKE